MILFFQTRRDLASYFNTLRNALAKPAMVLKSSRSIIPDISALTQCHSNKFDDAIHYKIIEKRYTHHHELSWIETAFYRIKSAWLYAADIHTLRKNKATLVVIWNGLKYRQLLTVKAAQDTGIRIVYMENGLLPGTTVCDMKGVNAGNSLPRDKAFYLQLPADLPPFVPATLIPRANVGNRISARRSLPEKFIFVPFQVDSDSQIIQYSPWIKNMQQLFDNCCAAAKGRYSLVFKEHPSSHVNYDHLHLLANEQTGIMFANDYPTQELIEKADAVITINSTVGIESLAYGKKVIVLGEACYAIEGMVLTAHSSEDLDKALAGINTFFPDEKLRLNFLAYLQNEYLVKGDWRHADDAHIKQLVQRLESFAP